MKIQGIYLKEVFILLGVSLIIFFLGFFIGKSYNQNQIENSIIQQKDKVYHEKADSINTIIRNIPFYYTDSARAEVLRNYSKYR